MARGWRAPFARGLPRWWVFAALGFAGCDADDFAPSNAIESVRVLAVQADKPFAQPGDTVNLTILAADGRLAPATPMELYWVPVLCENPTSDAYYNCFSSTSSTGSIGFDAGVGGDITSELVTGPSYSFQMPPSIISDHPAVPGAAAPYGLAIVFAIACAGRIEIVQVNPLSSQSVPVACVDDTHAAVGPDDYVIAFTRVYAYMQFTNANPVIDSVTLAGSTVDLSAGVVLPRCTSSSGCNLEIDVSVPPSSQETYVAESSGATTREQIWVDYFTSLNQFDSDALLLYDPVVGAVSGSSVHYQVPSAPGQGVVWVVVRDNRDGVNWVQFPVEVQ